MDQPIYVIGYARVSTPKQAQTGESLEAQEKAIRKYCEKKGYALFPDNKVFKEPYSGSNLFRPAYREILGIIKNNIHSKTKVKYLVFWDFDRLTRGGSADYDQIWKDVSEYGVELRDTTEIIQQEVNIIKEEFGLDIEYGWSTARPSEEAEKTKAEDARKHKRKILQTMITAEIRLTIDGYHIGRPDYGFQNKKIFVGTKKKCIQERFEPEAVFVERIYKLRAEGILSDQEICNDVNALGYKSRTFNKWNKDKTKVLSVSGGNKLTVKQLQDMIKRFTYCGVICERWTKYQPIKAKYEGLVTIDQWNTANRGKVQLEIGDDDYFTLLKDVNIHSKKRKKYNPNFPFKGVLICEVCGKVMKASASTGKSGKPFPAYHCGRGHKNNGIPKKELEDAFNNYLEKIKFTDRFLNIFEKTVYLQYRKREGELADYTSKANINVGELEEQKSALIKSFPTATHQEVRKGIEDEITKLQEEIAKARTQREKMELEEADVENFIAWCKETMEHPTKILTDIRSEQELVNTFSLFFDKFPTYTELVSGTPKLSLVFKLSEEFKVNQDLLVSVQQIELSWFVTPQSLFVSF